MDAQDNTIKEVSVECSLEDELPDLLQKVSRESAIDKEEFGCTFQFEISNLRGGKLVHFTEQFIPSSASSKSKLSRAFVDSNGEENNDCDYHGVTSNFVYDLDDVSVFSGSIPIITIQLNSSVMEFAIEREPPFHSISDESFKDPRYVASVLCLRVSDRSSDASEKFYPISESGEPIDLCSGETITIEDGVAHIAEENRRIDRVFVLLSGGSRLPKWPFPAKFGLTVAVRDGIEFKIEDNVVLVNHHCSPLPPSRRWICYKKLPGLLSARTIAKVMGQVKDKSGQTRKGT